MNEWETCISEWADRNTKLQRELADVQATVEALQAQYSELLEALDCVLAERPLPSGEYVHRVSCSGDRRKPAGTVGISCSCRVGQQQVEALQAKVSELQGIADEKCRCFLERAEQSEKQLTQRTAELERVRLLIKALPKVEGEVTVRDITALCWANDGTYGSIDCKEQLVSLLQERQKLC